jgi:hypothetical protein
LISKISPRNSEICVSLEWVSSHFLLDTSLPSWTKADYAFPTNDVDPIFFSVHIFIRIKNENMQ